MPLRPLLWIALAAAIPPHDPPPRKAEEPFPTAKPGEVANLRFSISDASGRPIPGRLTFVDGKGEEPELFVKTDPAGGVLAVRKNVAYSLGKPVTITVPPGRYTVHATHGIEWSRATTELSLEAGKTVEWSPRLVHEIDTPGWVSGDFHLHTLTYSGHGDANLNERLISLLGEGVEFAVATDHNHVTDYGPTVRSLGAEGSITTVSGNEVSTEIGHFNAFPLDPARPPVDHREANAHALFRAIRLEAGPSGLPPVIQVNHPRYAKIDYFGLKGLDPVTGASGEAGFSFDFDSLEILNGNPCWGWVGLEPHDRVLGTNLHSVLHDWFRILDRGGRQAGVGNSDSHTVHYDMAGYPRNYVRLDASSPGAIDPAAVAAAVRAKALFTTTGPFLRFEVEGAPMGGSAVARARADGSRSVAISIEVRSASWIPFDRVLLVVNGEVARRFETADRHRFETRFEHPVPRDAWVCVLVEGGASLWPLVGTRENPTRPIAVSNPFWLDAEGDGKWTSPWENALAAASEPEDVFSSRWDSAEPWERCRLLLAALGANPERARRLVPASLAHPDRSVRLAGARCAESLAHPKFRESLRAAWSEAGSDEYLHLALLRARARCGEEADLLLASMIERIPKPEPARLRREVGPILASAFVTKWKAIGYFPAAEKALVRRDFGPEADADVARTWPGKDETKARWVGLEAEANGFLSLAELEGGEARSKGAIAYAQTWLHSPDDRKVACALGTDDGGRVWVGGALVHESAARKRADPFERLALVRLEAGWNRVLFKVENVVGPTGLYFRVFDPGVRASAVPE